MSPHAFSLRQLQYAVAVADALSFSRAAEACHVSQPSLSAQLAQLERALGVTLFERDQRKVMPTAAGRELIARARRLVTDADDLGTAAQRLADPLSGTLRLGVIPTLSPYLLPAITPALRRAFPHLKLAWVEDKTAALAEALEAGRLDGALVALEAELPDFEHDVIGIDRFVLAFPRGHAFSHHRGPVSLDQLKGVDFLLLDDGHCFRDQALEVCSRSRAHEVDFRATSLSTLVQMVAGGAGLTLLPELAAPTELQRARLESRPLAWPKAQRTLALVWRKRAPLAEALRALAKVIRETQRRPGAGP